MKNIKSKILRAVRDPIYLLNVITRRLNKLKNLKHKKEGYACLPNCITLSLTNSCNLRCYMCAQQGDSGVCKTVEREFMPLSLVEKLVNELGSYRVHFTLMGGEPALHSDWEKIVLLIKKHHHTCEIITNGTLLHRDAEAIVNSKIDSVSVSLDGVGEVHDTIRGVQGVFEKVQKGLEALFYQIQKANAHTQVSIFSIITKENFNQLVDFAEWLRDKPISVLRFFHLRFFTNNEIRQNHEILLTMFDNKYLFNSGFCFDPGNIDADILADQISQLKCRNLPFSIVFQPEIPLKELDGYYHQEFFKRPGFSLCSIPWDSMVLLQNGFVHPCLEIEMGNLNESSLMEIWNGERYRNFRKKILEVKRLPLCHRCCN